jgi:hypothetical protein
LFVASVKDTARTQNGPNDASSINNRCGGRCRRRRGSSQLHAPAPHAVHHGVHRRSREKGNGTTTSAAHSGSIKEISPTSTILERWRQSTGLASAILPVFMLKMAYSHWLPLRTLYSKTELASSKACFCFGAIHIGLQIWSLKNCLRCKFIEII